MTAAAPVVTVYDPLWDIDWSYAVERARLRDHGVELLVPEDAAAVERDAARADVIIVVSRRIDGQALRAMPNLVGIVCYSVGMDVVDLDAAERAGVSVRNVASYCTEEVSDHALALLLALERRLFPIAAAGRDWEAGYRAAWSIRRLRGQTLGIVGAGRIGRMTARKARAFGFRTVGCDPYLASSEDEELPLRPFIEVIERADAIVACASITETSKNLFDASSFSRMKTGALFINVARGALVDEAALAAALRSGHLGGAALDVRAVEPPARSGDPLDGAPNLLLTPHIAAASVQAREDLHVGAAEVALELLEAAGRLPRPLPSTA